MDKSRSSAQTRGRPKERGEKVKMDGIYMKPSVWAIIDGLARQIEAEANLKEGDINRSEVLRRLVDQAIQEKRAPKPLTTIPLLGSVPCGPLDEALDEASEIDIGSLGDALRVRRGDFLLLANGTSMESHNIRRHIPDGSLMLFRPGIFPNNEPALIQTIEDGEYKFTVKNCLIGLGGTVILTDGEGNRVEVDQKLQPYPVAVFRGLVAAEIDLSDSELYERIRELQRDIGEYKRETEDLRIAVTKLDEDYPEEMRRFAERLGYSTVPEWMTELSLIMMGRGHKYYRDWQRSLRTTPVAKEKVG